MTVTLQQQQLMDSFYALDNVITIKITMPQGEWDKVRNEEPKGGRCFWEWKGGSRYTWRKADSVEISGTKFPARTTFTNVGIKKKSFCGSIDDKKPCVHIDFGRFSSTAEDCCRGADRNALCDAQQLQTGQVLHQADAGLPDAPDGRPAQFAVQLRQGVRERGPDRRGTGQRHLPGDLRQREPIMKRYIERNFNGNMNGNLYEIEHTDDSSKRGLPFIGVESLSEFDDKDDLKFACRHIKANGLAGADEMLDMDQFSRSTRWSFLFKHWDGYANNTNKHLPLQRRHRRRVARRRQYQVQDDPVGIDQILKPRESFRLGRMGVIAQLVRNDDARRKQLMDQIRAYRETLFSRAHQQTVLKPLIDQMQVLLTGPQRANVVNEIGTVRQQLRLAESAAYIFTGLPEPTDPVYILKHDTSNCLHASNTESIPPGDPAPVNFEVYHQQLFDNNHPTDLWALNDLGTGKSLTNQAFNRNLHASGTQVTPAGTSSSTRARRATATMARSSLRALCRCPSSTRQPAWPLRLHRLLQHRQRADLRDGEVRQ
jgi:hypothetical protein